MKNNQAGISPGKFNKPFLLWTFFGTALFILLWEFASVFFGSELIFPGPVPVIKKLFTLVFSPAFLSALVSSFVRVMAGMIVSVPLGCAAGIAAGLDRRSASFLGPFFSVIAATPVMSVILICFLFMGAERTPVFTAFLMVFPVMAANTQAGILQTDSNLKEMFAVYNVGRGKTLRCLYLPSIMPYALGGLRSSLSLCWKVVIAAEVLVQPARSLGAGMQQAKAQLETPGLFAWTCAAVIAASITQGILTLVIKVCRPGAAK